MRITEKRSKSFTMALNRDCETFSGFVNDAHGHSHTDEMFTGKWACSFVYILQAYCFGE